MLFYTACNISQLVGQYNITVFADLDEAADRIADRLLAGPFEFALHSIPAGAGGGNQLECKGYAKLVLRMVHNPLRAVNGALYLAVHRQRNGVQQAGLAAARRTEDPEQAGLGQAGKINLLLLPVALESGEL
ncbi:hypothetical protein D3C73_840950 [compost metagenome]